MHVTDLSDIYCIYSKDEAAAGMTFTIGHNSPSFVQMAGRCSLVSRRGIHNSNISIFLDVNDVRMCIALKVEVIYMLHSDSIV